MERTIAEHEMFRPGDGILVGLSGGVDSWALLLGLCKVRERHALRIHAGIVDHGLRPEAAQEAQQTAALCAERGIPCTVLRLRLGKRSGAAKPSVSQARARAARLSALERLAKKLDYQRIALAHQAEDQAETVLFRIVRGTGLRGLGGIPHRRGLFIRPLLDVRRDEIERFVKKAGITPVRDPSNADRRFARARVRHDWIPFLRKENPRLVDALLGLARAAHAVAESAPSEPLPGDWSQATRATVRTLVLEHAGTKVVDVRGGRVEVRYGEVRAVPRPVRTAGSEIRGAPGKNAGKTAPNAESVKLLGPGRARLAVGGPAIELKVRRQAPPGDASFDADVVGWPLFLRTWQPGDRLRPRGGTGSRKLQDLFVDAKIPRGERGSLPVLTNAQGDILFVPGLRPSELSRPDARTRRWLVVRAWAAQPAKVANIDGPRIEVNTSPKVRRPA